MSTQHPIFEKRHVGISVDERSSELTLLLTEAGCVIQSVKITSAELKELGERAILVASYHPED